MANSETRVDDFDFDGGRLTSFNTPDLRKPLADGEAFRTSSCPDCNRPFYNERPGGTMYNYPRPLTVEEMGRAIEEMRLHIATGQ